MSFSNMSHPDLVQACLKKDEDAWKEFRARYHKTISLAVLRTARRWKCTSLAIVEELIGDTYVKLCDNDLRLLRNFQFRSDASIFGYLKVVATNVVHDHFRHFKVDIEVSIEELYEGTDPPIPVPEGPDNIERNVQIKEVEEALFEVTGPDGERDRTIFWLYHLQRFTAEEIAALPFCLTTKGVESVIHRVTKAVRARLTEKAASCAAAESEK